MLEFVLEWLSRPYLCGPALATGVLTGRVGPHLVIFTSPLTLQEHTEVLYIVNIYSPPPPPDDYGINVLINIVIVHASNCINFFFSLHQWLSNFAISFIKYFKAFFKIIHFTPIFNT